MIIQLQPEQISTLWEGIKYGVLEVNRVVEKDKQRKLNAVLKNLLSGYFQCWIIYEEVLESKQLHGFAITYTMKDKLTDESIFTIDTVYGYRKIDSALMSEAIEKVKDYAKAIGCNEIRFNTTNDRVAKIMGLFGFKLIHQIYSLEV